MDPISIGRLYTRDIGRLRAIVTEEIALKANLPWPFTIAKASYFINDYHTYGMWYWGELIGALEVKPTGETAYFISDKYRNKGYTTASIKMAKEKYPHGQLWCYIHPDNVASMRVATKAGIRIQYYSEIEYEETNNTTLIDSALY